MSGAHLDNAVTRTLGERYRLLARIGSGASADVYQATDLRLGRDVALKQLRPNLTEDPRFARLFRSEAHLAAQLSHPNILTVFDWSADEDGTDGGAYIVTELLVGGSLRDFLLVEGTLSLSQVAFIGLQTARGLATAHERGLVHRDIKPANLLFGADGRIHIGDFGIARAVAKAAWTEPEGVLIGTARYAAPEQSAGGAISGQVDVYSLALCMVEALTGEVPLVRENAMGTMMLRQEHDIPVDDSYGPLLEPLAWAGAADPAERATAAEFRDALLVVCRTLPDPDPLVLVDLTEVGLPSDASRTHPQSQSQTPAMAPDERRPNVRIAEDGSLIIEEDDGSELAIEADPAARSTLNERTSDGYLPPDEDSPRRRRWPRVLGGIAFIGLALAALAVGALVAQNQRGEVERIELGVPSYPIEDYRPLTVDEVRAIAEGNIWTVAIAERFADGTAPGQILAQLPPAGQALGPGGEILLTVSLGPEQRLVPEMVGLPVDDVRRAIASARLLVGSVGEQASETVEKGLVIEATIDGVPAQPGTEFLTGTTIDLLVSSGPEPRTVPALIGLNVEQARVTIEELGLVLATSEAYSETVAEGLIIGIQPGAESRVARGSTVTATVSLGRPFVQVPDMIGLSVSAAIDELRALGFEVAINGTVGAEVIATRPTPGTSVRTGSEIELISSAS